MKTCSICKHLYDENEPDTLYGEAGEWLAEERWNDAGELCRNCRENRARLVMMYCHDIHR